MKGRLEITLLLIWLMIACSQPNKKFKQVELLRLGLPESLDTSNLYKIGAADYFSFDHNSDSVLVKTYDLVDLENGMAQYPARATYQKWLISQEDKEDLDSIIDYLLPISNGQLPNNKKPEDWGGCDHFGSWIIIVTDDSNIRHYYVFGSYELERPLRALCDKLMSNADKVSYLPSRADLELINTDSLTECYTNNLLKADLADILPPPLKSTVKFTPPSIDDK